MAMTGGNTNRSRKERKSETEQVIFYIYLFINDREKTDLLLDRVMELVAYKSLVEMNRERERTDGRPADGSTIYLPFVAVNTDKRYEENTHYYGTCNKFMCSYGPRNPF